MATVSKLYKTYGQEIYRFCLRQTGNRSDAEDLAQEVFLAASTGLGRFRSESSYRTWLYRIAFHKCKDFRGLHRRSEVPLREHTAQVDNLVDLDALVLEQALQELAEPNRTAFCLVKVAGFSCKEAGVIVGAPEGTVKSRIHDAVHELQAKLAPPSPNPLKENLYA